MALILDGKIVRDQKKAELTRRVSGWAKNSGAGVKPTLAIVQVGDSAESNTYIAQKIKFGAEIGVEVRHIRLGSNALGSGLGKITTENVLAEVAKLNADKSVHGIIVQLPLPIDLDRTRILAAVDPTKDVDGLSPASTQKLVNAEKGFVPATAKGVLSLLKHYDIPVAGKRVTVVGRSGLVGRPIALALLALDATVTVCHSKTLDLKSHTKSADIVIVAIGQPEFITAEYLSAGQVVVDVGINLVNQEKNVKKLEDEVPATPKIKLVGDVAFAQAEKLVKAISPVPGGVGPLTVASLFENLLDAAVIDRP